MANFSVVEQTKRIVTLTFSDRLDAFNAPAARKQIEGLLANGAAHFVLDLSEVTFLDSAGVAVMVNLLKKARAADGNVMLVSPNSPAAQRILRLTRFDQVFGMYPTAAEAAAAF